MRERGSWLGGLIVIAIGVAFLLRNFGWVEWPLFENWWALFILIPALASLGNAWRSYGADGRLNGEVIGSLIGGLLLLMIALVFLLQLDWGAIWPVFLILGGLSLLLRSMFSRA
jgi:hypothetical protein